MLTNDKWILTSITWSRAAEIRKEEKYEDKQHISLSCISAIDFLFDVTEAKNIYQRINFYKSKLIKGVSVMEKLVFFHPSTVLS